MCKARDIETALIQINDTLCRIAVALEQLGQSAELIDFDSINWDALDTEDDA